MKSVDKEKLISKNLLKTAVVILVMVFISLAKRGYEYPYGTMSLTTGKIVLLVAILLLINAGVFVYLGFKKNQKFFEISAWSAGLATFVMLVKINFGNKDLLSVSSNTINENALIHIKLPAFLSSLGTLNFFRLTILVCLIYLVVIWVRAIVKIVKK